MDGRAPEPANPGASGARDRPRRRLGSAPAPQGLAQDPVSGGRVMGALRFGFGESVVFGALAALSFIPAARMCEIRDGTMFAVSYVTLVTAIYVVLLRVRGAHSLAAVGIVLLAGAASSLASTVAPAAFAL